MMPGALLALLMASCTPPGQEPFTSTSVCPSPTQFLDVRTAEEWEEGHIAGAKLVTLGGKDFVPRTKAVIDPKQAVLVYCHSGGRSEEAAKELRAAGFSQVFEMEGGIAAWEESGKPLVKGP